MSHATDLAAPSEDAVDAVAGEHAGIRRLLASLKPAKKRRGKMLKGRKARTESFWRDIELCLYDEQVSDKACYRV